MSDIKNPQEKLSAQGADIAGSVNEAVNKAKPALGHMADRVNDSLQDLAQRGKESALEAEHRMAKEALNAKRAAEHYIQHAPFQSVMIAAGTGAAMALALSWLMYMRKS